MRPLGKDDDGGMDGENRKSWRTLLIAGVYGLVAVGIAAGVSVGVEPRRPTLEDISRIPGLPSLPPLPTPPTGFPGFPEIPGYPTPPQLPDLPELPDLPPFPGSGS